MIKVEVNDKWLRESLKRITNFLTEDNNKFGIEFNDCMWVPFSHEEQE